MTAAEYKARQELRRKRSDQSIIYNPEWSPEGSRNRYRWVEHPEDGLRFVGNVDEITNEGASYTNMPYFDRALVEHTGWFLDDDDYQAETAWGVVYQLPGKNGESRYIPGMVTSLEVDRKKRDTRNGGAILDFHSVTTDIREAIRWADRMAQYYAEDEREYQAKERVKIRLEEIEEEIQSLRSEYRALRAEVRSNWDTLRPLKEVRKLLKRTKDQMQERKKELYEERKELL